MKAMDNKKNVSIESRELALAKEEKNARKAELRADKLAVKMEKKNAKQSEKKKLKKQQKEFEKWLAEKEAIALEESNQPRRLYETEKEPSKALATFFRNQNKMMVTSMAIADRKAMIMIRINSLIVTVAMIFYRYINDGLPMGWLIGIILIAGTGAALIFAVLAARPNQGFFKKLGEEEVLPAYPKLEYRNFWVTQDVSLMDYEESMDKVINSQELQIGNQIRFNYVMDKHLSSKYRLLDIAYNLFLVTLILSGVAFVFCRIMYSI